MKITVRPAELRADRIHITALLTRYLAPDAGQTRFEWLYEKNPCGPPRVWVAQESQSSQIIGTAAAFPRSLYIGHQRKTGWVLGDFCMSEQYRSLGPALQLQRACLEGLEPLDDSIWYDFPSQSMLAIYKRLRAPASKKMIRFVRPLKVDRKVATWTKSDLLKRGLSHVGNVALNLSHRRAEVPTGYAIHSLEGDCGPEFNQLSEEIGGKSGNCVERMASYLNWKYRQNPCCPCQIITIRKAGVLKGYAVLTEMGTDIELIDLFSFQERDVVESLLQSVIDRARSFGSETVMVSLIEGHPWISSLQAMGFIPRETSPVIIGGLPCVSEQLFNGEHRASLLLMQGDRDS